MACGGYNNNSGYQHGSTDLRIVLLGERWSRKSSAGNTILREDVFKVDRRTASSEVRQGGVAGRKLMVVDSPGWYNSGKLEDTSEMDKLEIRSSVSLCPPGPHAVLLVISVDAFFCKESLEDHMSLYSGDIWSHTIVLFTCGDKLGDQTIGQHIESEGKDLQGLLEKCGNRHHVFNNNNRGDVRQVTELLNKIDEMVAGNGGRHFEVDREVLLTLKKRSGGTWDKAEIFKKQIQRQNSILDTLFEGEDSRLAELRMMMVGTDQEGKHEAGNAILKKRAFRPHMNQCLREQGRVGGRNLVVVISSRWRKRVPSEQSKQDIQHGVDLCSPGPHVLLLALSVAHSFSEADRVALEEHMQVLGDRVWRHTLVLFIRGYWLGDRTIEEYIESEGEALKSLLVKCGNRYHVLKRQLSEETSLVKKIEKMVMRNRGHFTLHHEREEEGAEHSLPEEEWSQREEEWRRGEEEWRKRCGNWSNEIKWWNKTQKYKEREKEWKRREEEWRRKEYERSRREEALKRREERLIDGIMNVVITDLVRRSNSYNFFPPNMTDDLLHGNATAYRAAGLSDHNWMRSRDRASPPPSVWDESQNFGCGSFAGSRSGSGVEVQSGLGSFGGRSFLSSRTSSASAAE